MKRVKISRLWNKDMAGPCPGCLIQACHLDAGDNHTGRKTLCGPASLFSAQPGLSSSCHRRYHKADDNTLLLVDLSDQANRFACQGLSLSLTASLLPKGSTQAARRPGASCRSVNMSGALASADRFQGHRSIAFHKAPCFIRLLLWYCDAQPQRPCQVHSSRTGLLTATILPLLSQWHR